jgi:non-lysosomal glucosylceramidase
MAAPRIPYDLADLTACGPQRTYRGRNLDLIAFPLGGIGTGCVSLGGWGQLRDWEICNRPAKGRANANAFFTIRVEQKGRRPLVKALQGPAGGTYVDGGHSAGHDAGEGLPHFRDCSFRGEYPFAEVTLSDPGFPVRVQLLAFNPFIPLNQDDSSIPVAVLMYTVENTTNRPLTVSVMGNLTNFIGEREGRVNRKRGGRGLKGLWLAHEGHEPDDPRFGTMTLCTPAEEAWVWSRWSDSRLLKFWDAVAWSEDFPPCKQGDADTGTLGVTLTIPGEASVTIPFFVAWHFPNFEHWHRPEGADRGATWLNWYATQWKDAWDVAAYTHKHFHRLYEDTRAFHDSLFSSTLPVCVLDAISANLSILKSPTCLRLTDGTFYGFEGCSNTAGCCEGSCTHVWNYAQALPYLFPALQRSQREADWANSLQDDGFVSFRMPLPLGTRGDTGFHPAADGQMGTVIQAYREWQICGDDAWLARIWPKAKRALEFAWKYWDADRDGVMEGMQHNTYDMEFWGPNSMMTGLYLGALRAGEKMASHLGDEESAAEYRRLHESGSHLCDAILFNGEYYEQIVNTEANKGWPEHLCEKCMGGFGRDDRFPRWPRWQFGRGCLSDQLLGEWYATMLGLGHLFRPAHVRKTLQSIFRYNWKPDLTDHFCSLRIYAINQEAGLVIATWPRGERPGYAFWFADEVWCGIEYQVASHLIYEGFVAEGLAIVKGVRDRHTGQQRNPWDEFECGHHYSRSLASYALLTALSGFSYSAPEQRIGFAPRLHEDDFEAFFSVGSGWGSYRQALGDSRVQCSIEVERGSLTLREWSVSARGAGQAHAWLRGEPVPLKVVRRGGTSILRFETAVTIGAGEVLTAELS